MQRIPAQSPRAVIASHLTQSLQLAFLCQLERVSGSVTNEQCFDSHEWFRDEGLHGGGLRYFISDSDFFNRASINFSQVHYDDDDSKSLASATALSTIIHPQNPHAPSLHMHISWTELKEGRGYWRIMADLNPALVNTQHHQAFKQCLKQAAPNQYDSGTAQGDRYFHIPVLNRHRGIQHFYLEQYNSGDNQGDINLAHAVGEAVIQCYCDLLAEVFNKPSKIEKSDVDKQLAYHTLYFFQVLTLDRGTTSGLLIHDQNDVGILASLPAQIDRELLSSWQELMPEPQNFLLDAILQELPQTSPCLISEDIKDKLAKSIRQHYQNHPKAITLQASGGITPPTVANHR
ncbi:MAG: coproporphyrinogen III oxidase [Methylococcaceae bacterium]|nr:coproporphyrinogen III oxidase [Methylococcaceae bacterium]